MSIFVNAGSPPRLPFSNELPQRPAYSLGKPAFERFLADFKLSPAWSFPDRCVFPATAFRREIRIVATSAWGIGAAAFIEPTNLRSHNEEFEMKRLVLALTAVAAFAAPAFAADMAARPYTKAPMMAAPITNWTGCWVGAGAGYGLTNNDSYLRDNITGLTTTTRTTQGARGYLGTVGAGCDYQFNNFVIGGFADGDWTGIRGDHTGQSPGAVGLSATGRQTLDYAWNVGGRAGYLITPSLLTYFTAGYTQAHFTGVNYVNLVGTPTGFGIASQNYGGYFIGAGDEYALNFLPGLFWKTEYRFSDYNSKDVAVFATATGVPTGVLEHTHNYVHTVRSSLTYHFNWGGPVVARY
jgi:outer membrane immunogenic protein